jgi:hypothetical protein
MKSRQLLQLFFLLCFSYQSCVASSTLDSQTSILKDHTHQQKIDLLRNAYFVLLAKFEITETDQKCILSEPKLIAKTRFLLGKYLESPGEKLSADSSNTLSVIIDKYSDYDIITANGFQDHNLDSTLAEMMKLFPVIKYTSAQSGTSVLDAIHSFYGLLALIVIALAVISIFTWQFYKKSSSEDLQIFYKMPN